jgi:hypothetical protein
MTNNEAQPLPGAALSGRTAKPPVIDLNRARRRHFSPEEMKLCRRIEAEFEIERDQDPMPWSKIDLNGARPHGEARRNRIDVDDIRDRLNAIAESFVTRLFPNAVVSKGNARLGSTLGEPGTSLSIELVGPRVGKWNDHATGTGGNDLIGLFCAYRGYSGKADFPLALNEIAHDFLGDPVQFIRPTARPTPHQQIEATKKTFADQRKHALELGLPVRIFHYYSASRNVIAKVCRYEPDGRESKTFRTYSFEVVDGIPCWKGKMPNPRPLYRLPEIALADAVVLTEGEAKADALAALGIVATSVMGGANATGKVDWTPLANKQVIIWPDADTAGATFARDATAVLIALGCRVAIVQIPPGKVDGWDAVDCIAEGGDARALIDGAIEVNAGSGNTGQQSGGAGPSPNPLPSPLEQTLQTFQNWLLLTDTTPVLAVFGAIAANLLDGDPVWLGLIGPPSSAKSEILNSTSKLPKVFQAATLSPAGLLSGTPKKQQAQGAAGGLLRQIGDLGIIALKDFGSVLSMRPDQKAEILAALREIFDGAWTRTLGTDGGKTLNWQGKIGLIFAATSVIDSHYGVIGSMGDRFLLCRLAPVAEGQFPHALKHAGSTNKQMRQQLAAAVAQLFAARAAAPQSISQDELERLDKVVSLVVRLRASVERDRNSREIEALHGTEGTARLGLQLERLLAGLDVLGVDRELALNIVEQIALDSVPPLRRAAYQKVCDYGGMSVETGDVASKLGLPTSTVRRALEDLAAYQLIRRFPQGAGKADKWRKE